MRKAEQRRSDIERGIEKNREASEKGQRKLDQDVKDKTLIAEVARKMRGKATMEGMELIARHGQQAGEKVDRETDKDGQQLDRDVHRESRDREQDLKERSRETSGDARDLEHAGGHLSQEQSKAELRSAACEATADQKYLAEKEKRQQEIRTRSEEKAAEKRGAVQKLRPNFRRQ